MASFLTDVPDALVADLVLSIAPSLVSHPTAAVRTAALKASAGTATTGAEKALLGEAFTKAALKEALLNYRAQQAATAARVNPNDPAVTW